MAKCANETDKERIRDVKTPILARMIGRRVELRADWESKKVKIMVKILRSKFEHSYMRELLLTTKDYEIMEINPWHDTFWGVCCCDEHAYSGSNMMGKLLMDIRYDIRYDLAASLKTREMMSPSAKRARNDFIS